MSAALVLPWVLKVKAVAEIGLAVPVVFTRSFNITLLVELLCTVNKVGWLAVKLLNAMLASVAQLNVAAQPELVTDPSVVKTNVSAPELWVEVAIGGRELPP